jgi:DNA-directed RNA polymerase subunit M/transcription elongation factor TFIIS
LAVLSLNSCPRCQGDMVLDNKDQYGWYEQCLQCGYIHDLETIVQVDPQSVERRKKTKVGGPKRKALR